MKKQGLPHKKILLGALLGIIVLGVLYVVFNDRTTTFELEEDEIAQSFEEVENNDSDGDGLADWEEIIAGLNPYDVDTDGDGVSDYELVRAARVLLAQTDESGNPVTGDSVGINREDSGSTNYTDTLGRQLYGVTAALEATGSLTTEKREEMVNAFVTDLSTAPDYPTHSILELHITDELGNGDEITYLQRVVDLLGEYQYLEPSPLGTLEESLERDDPSFVEEGLVLVLENQRNTRDTLLTMKVFPQYLTQHVELLNLVERILINTEQIQQFYQDPVKNYIGIVEFSNHAEAFAEALLDFTETVNETISYYELVSSAE